MPPRTAAPTRIALALLGVAAFVGCGGDGDGASRDFCAEVCEAIESKCDPSVFVGGVRPDCEEECRTELRSRLFDEGEDVCIDCCIDVVLPAFKCTDVLTFCQDSNLPDTMMDPNDPCVIGDNPDDDPTDTCQRKFGFSLCLDDDEVCGTECSDNIDNFTIPNCMIAPP